MRQLTEEKRNQIEILLKAGKSQSDVANLVGCHQCTISRELSRNSSPITKLYRGKQAHQRSVERRKQSYKGRRWHDDPNLLDKVLTLLKDKRSPDQISGRIKQQGGSCVSFQSIYNFIRADKYAGGELYKYLRYQGKKYKWRGFSKADKTRIPNRKGIEERPEIVDQKKRAGDWETDLVISNKKGSGAVATFVERVSLYFQADLVHSQSAPEMVRATKKCLGAIPKHLRLTMTHDNGKEIAQHEQITEDLGIDVYCARPYRSSDRGLNEFMNRELRRFFPKGTDFSTVKPKELASAVDWLNNLPRRSLNFQTPNEVFMQFIL